MSPADSGAPSRWSYAAPWTRQEEPVSRESIVIAPTYVLLALIGNGIWLVLGSAAHLLMNFKSMADNIVLVSFRQRVTPDRLLGRMNATMRFVLWGMIPLGAALSGLVGEYAGVRTALWVGTTGMAVSWLPVALSPLRTMRRLPPAAEATDR